MSKYSVIIVPENHLETKSFHLSKPIVHFSFFSLVALLLLCVGMGWGFIHYRSVAKQLSEKSEPLDEALKTQLISKINTLEDSLNRTQQYAMRMESMAGVDASKLKVGIGPLGESKEIQQYLDRLKKMPKPNTSSEELHLGKGAYQNLNLRLDELNEYALVMENRMNDVYELGQDKITFWSSTPSLLPVKGWVTSLFGSRISPITGTSKFHEGLDIAAPIGTPVYASADGVASFSGQKGGYGNALVIDHGYGLTTLYGHASALLVKQGQKVKRGQLIALVGSTGSSTGPHLHYEVHVDGIPTDPMKFVKN